MTKNLNDYINDDLYFTDKGLKLALELLEQDALYKRHMIEAWNDSEAEYLERNPGEEKATFKTWFEIQGSTYIETERVIKEHLGIR